MYAKIKALADEAIALQNKDRMDAVLREISGIAAKLIAEPMRGLSQADIAALLPNCADVVRQWAAAQPGDTVQDTGVTLSQASLTALAEELQASGEKITLDGPVHFKVTAPAKGKKGTK